MEANRQAAYTLLLTEGEAELLDRLMHKVCMRFHGSENEPSEDEAMLARTVQDVLSEATTHG